MSRQAPNLRDPVYRKPFEYGWRRELVIRKNNRDADVYYYTPSGSKMRSLKQLSGHLTHDLKIENFSFSKNLIGLNPSQEKVRRAVDRGRKLDEPNELSAAGTIIPFTKNASQQHDERSPLEKLHSKRNEVVKEISKEGVFRGFDLQRPYTTIQKSMKDKVIDTSNRLIPNPTTLKPKNPIKVVKGITASSTMEGINVYKASKEISTSCQHCSLSRIIVPDVQCQSCETVFHSQCVGAMVGGLLQGTFICQRCSFGLKQLFVQRGLNKSSKEKVKFPDSCQPQSNISKNKTSLPGIDPTKSLLCNYNRLYKEERKDKVEEWTNNIDSASSLTNSRKLIIKHPPLNSNNTNKNVSVMNVDKQLRISSDVPKQASGLSLYEVKKTASSDTDLTAGMVKKRSFVVVKRSGGIGNKSHHSSITTKEGATKSLINDCKRIKIAKKEEAGHHGVTAHTCFSKITNQHSNSQNSSGVDLIASNSGTEDSRITNSTLNPCESILRFVLEKPLQLVPSHRTEELRVSPPACPSRSIHEPLTSQNPRGTNSQLGIRVIPTSSNKGAEVINKQRTDINRRLSENECSTPFLKIFRNVKNKEDSELLNRIFGYLGTKELLKLRLVSKTFRRHSSFMLKNLKLQGLAVKDWFSFREFLISIEPHSISFEGIFQDADNIRQMWCDSQYAISNLNYIKELHFGPCPSFVLNSLPNYTFDLHRISAELTCKTSFVDFKAISEFIHLKNLNLICTRETSMEFKNCQYLLKLKHLETLILKGAINVDQLAQYLPENLKILELDNCSNLIIKYKLEYLEKLRLENILQIYPLPITCSPPGLINHPILTKLELINVHVYEGFDRELRKCLSLKSFTVVPNMQHMVPKSIDTILSGVFHLQRPLKFFEIGIIWSQVRLTEYSLFRSTKGVLISPAIPIIIHKHPVCWNMFMALKEPHPYPIRILSGDVGIIPLCVFREYLKLALPLTESRVIKLKDEEVYEQPANYNIKK